MTEKAPQINIRLSLMTHLLSNKKISSLFLGIVIFFLLCPLSFARDVSVIVNKTNPVNELSLEDLGRILKAERQYWDGEKIYLIISKSGSWEKDVILNKVYKMSEDEMKKFWLGKIFRGEITAFPSVFGSQAVIKKFVNSAANAISFIDSQNADDTVKVLKIEGRFPGEPGYPLRNE